MLNKLFSKKNTPLPILRIDDRLIHGQVVIGWGNKLDLQAIILACDHAAKDEMLKELYTSLIPPEIEGRVLPIAELHSYLDSSQFSADIMIVVENVDDALFVLDTGIKVSKIVLGGLHFKEGRHRLLSYIFIDDSGKESLKKLLSKGIPVVCQDLPSNPPYRITEKLLDKTN